MNSNPYSNSSSHHRRNNNISHPNNNIDSHPQPTINTFQDQHRTPHRHNARSSHNTPTSSLHSPSHSNNIAHSLNSSPHALNQQSSSSNNNNNNNNNNSNNNNNNFPSNNTNTASELRDHLHDTLLRYAQRYFPSLPDPGSGIPITNMKDLQSLEIALEIAVFFTNNPKYNLNFAHIKQSGAVWLDYYSLYDEQHKCDILPIPGFPTALKVDPDIILKVFGLALHTTVSYATDCILYPTTTNDGTGIGVGLYSFHVKEQDWSYPTLIVRLLNYPLLTPPREFGANTNGQYIAFHATITRLSTVRPLITSLPVVCPACTTSTIVTFQDGTYIAPKCKACPRSYDMVPQFHLAESVDWQEALVQEVIDPENNPTGHIPLLIEIEQTRDLITKFGVGDLVQISGVLKARPGRKNDQYVMWVDVNAIHVTSQPDISHAFSANMPMGLDSADNDLDGGAYGHRIETNDTNDKNDITDLNAPNSAPTSTEPNQTNALPSLSYSLDTDPYQNQQLQQYKTIKKKQQAHSHRLLLDHQQKRFQFLSELARMNEFFARVIMPLYIPLDFPPIVAGGFTINQAEFQGIATIHKQRFLPRYLIQSVCPQIYGHTAAKFGLLLGLLGGVDRSNASPQDESIKKFNTLLKDNGIHLKSDDEFFSQFQQHHDGNPQHYDGKNALHDTDGTTDDQSTDLHHKHSQRTSTGPLVENAIISNNLGGVISTSSLSSTPASRSLATNLRTRSNIHILLIGEPGLGKSQLLREVSTLVARGVYISGHGASGVGLTASLKKEGRGWTLQCGGVVIGDKGVTCIDELDKLGAETHALLECMEQQTVTITKAGTLCTLPARTTVVAAANPKAGVYDRSKSVLENLNISPILLSRFDLVFLILDQADGEFDSLLSEHVMNLRAGEEDKVGGFGGNQNGFVTPQQQQQQQQGYCTRFGPQLTPGQLHQQHLTQQQQQQQQLLLTPNHHLSGVSGGFVHQNPFQQHHHLQQQQQQQQQSTDHPNHFGLSTPSTPRFFDFPTPSNIPFSSSSSHSHLHSHSPSLPSSSSSSSSATTSTVTPIQSYDELLLQCGYTPQQPLSQRYSLSMNELDQLESIPSVLLKKYIAFAREYCRPTLSPQARDILQAFFLTLRSKVTSQVSSSSSSSSSSDTLAASTVITTRQLESLIRLTEARAKVELRPIALSIDAYEAIELVRETMFQQLIDITSTSSSSSSSSLSSLSLTPGPGSKGKQKGMFALSSSFLSQLVHICRHRGTTQTHTKQQQVVFSYLELKDIARRIPGFDMSKFTQLFDRLREQGDLIMDQGQSNVFRYTGYVD